MIADEDLRRHAAENLEQADALLFGRVTYAMMEAAWRPPAQTGERSLMSTSSGAAQAGGPWAHLVRGAIEAW